MVDISAFDGEADLESQLVAIEDRERLNTLYESAAGPAPATDTFSMIRPDQTRFWDRLTVRRFDVGADRYWVTAHEDASVQVAAERERATLAADVAEGAAAMQRILQVSDVIDSTVTISSAVAAIPALLVPSMARWAMVQLVAPGRDDWLATACLHEDGEFPPDYARYVTTLLPSQMRQSLHNAVLRGRRPYAVFKKVSTNDLEAAMPPEAAAVLGRMGLGPTLTVPLLAGTEVIGTIVLVGGDARGPYSEQDIEVARLIGQRAGVALRRVELEASRRHRSIEVQNALLPELLPMSGVEAIPVYRPSAVHASVGGDWYDLLPLADDRLILSIGDVAGHDVSAAATMARYRAMIRTYLWQGDDAGVALDQLDQLLVEESTFPHLATAVVGIVDRSDPTHFRLTYTSAGHPAAVALPPGEPITVLDGARSTPIGIGDLRGARPRQTIDLPYGTTIVLYTDGVVERRTMRLRDRIEALHEALDASPRDGALEDIRDTILAMTEHHRLEDDMCFLIVRVDPPGGATRKAAS